MRLIVGLTKKVGLPGFGSLAEAMSGFAAMTGEPDEPPEVPDAACR